MLRMTMSRAASGLLRALFDRAGCSRDRILLSEIRSVDWFSRTLAGERHSVSLRFPGPDAEATAGRFVEGLEDAEFAIPGQIVADIGLAGAPLVASDGSVTLAIEALTVLE